MKVVETIAAGMLTAGIVISTVKLLLKLAGTDAEENAPCMNQRIRLLCILNGALVYLWCDQSYAEGSCFYAILYGVLAGCLLMACITDCKSCTVYNYVWWVGGTICMLLLLFTVGNVHNISGLASLVLFVLLQEILFSKMYGKADCHAFAVCAAAESAVGFGIKEYLLHMLLAFILLLAVQGHKKNIGRNGNLKKPVPFLPYITISFWMLLLWWK